MMDYTAHNALLASLVALSAVLVLIPVFVALAGKAGFVDRPGGRKKHEIAVPPVGGLVVFSVFMLVGLLFGGTAVINPALLGALLLLLVIGGLDDRNELPAVFKFGAQFISAAIILFAGQTIVQHLGHFITGGAEPLYLGFMAIPFSLFCIALLINSMNLMDGLDGLAGGKAFVCLFWFALVSFHLNLLEFAFTLVVLMGSLLGFLVYNMRHPFRSRASVFLGDAGAMSLGLVLAWFSIHIAKAGYPEIEPIAIAWILAVPVMDTCAQFIRRIREGRHPFDADHHHFHHHFVNIGFSPALTTCVILSIGAVMGAIGYAQILFNIPAYLLTYIWSAILIFHVYMSLNPQRYRRLLKACIRLLSSKTRK
jgi:UDP-GlcNAc:undecaprenyl-phosphate GlcNAc-1-phosphate transferase